MRGRLLAGMSGLVCILPCTMAVPLSYAARLDPEQRRVARQADREADRFGASPKERLALFEGLAVEAVFRNPAGGDQDSVGSLQERDHYGSVRRRLNVKLASRRFLTEARALREQGFKGSAGDLAAAVQRPREDLRGRYDEERSFALEVVNQYGGLRNRGGSAGGLGGRAAGGGSPVGATAFDPGNPQATAQASLAAAPVPIASAPVPEPEFTARPVLPEGYAPAPSAGGPAPLPEMVASPEAGGLAEDFSPELAAPQGGGGRRGGSRGGGTVRGSTVRSIGAELEALASDNGWPIGSGTRSREDNAKVGGAEDSDHLAAGGRWARDFPISGQENIEAAGRRASEALGLNGKLTGTIKRGGKSFRVQIITKPHGTGPHLHVGVRRVG